jgi:hypothetical protein
VNKSGAGTLQERRRRALNRPAAVTKRRADRALPIVFLATVVALYAIVGWAIYIALGALF